MCKQAVLQFIYRYDIGIHTFLMWSRYTSIQKKMHCCELSRGVECLSRSVATSFTSLILVTDLKYTLLDLGFYVCTCNTNNYCRVLLLLHDFNTKYGYEIYI